MNIPQNTYYNQQPMMPPQPRMPMRQRMTKGILKIRNVFPIWLSRYPIAVYIITLTLVSFIYSEFSLPWYYMLSGVVAVLVFFLYGDFETKHLAIDKIRKEKIFERRIFFLAFIPRLIWMILIYIIFMNTYGDPFGFENHDTLFYDDIAGALADAIDKGDYIAEIKGNLEALDISDFGFPLYVSVIYWLTGKSIIAVRLLHCLWSSLTVILIYRLTKRNFGDQTARIAAIFCALWFNFWYYCGSHLKEPLMDFLVVLFVEQADQMLRSRKFTAWKILPVFLVGLSLFGFRTPLAIVAIIALVFTIVLSSQRVVSWGKKIIVGILAVALIGVSVGNQIEEQSRKLFDIAKSEQQKENMQWRSERKDGANAFAKYAGASVFAPLIFTIPFPTMTQPYKGQDLQQFLNGGNFVKNIISGFTILAMVMLLLTGKWRDHMLPLALTLGYLLVLTMSNFAQSERFHQPVMHLEMIFAAYGVTLATTKPKYKRWFMYWCGLMFIAVIIWNWFKLAGRGLV